MTEDASLRQSGDKLLARFIPYTSLKNSSNNIRQQSITLLFTEELCCGLELGISYNIVLSKDLKVWGYELLLPHPSRTISMHNSTINSFISYIRENVGNSPLSVLTGFAVQLDQSIYPPSAFLQMKTALLLSIASLNSSEAGVSVLALGDCSRLMNAALECCPRLLRTCVSNPQGNSSNETPYKWKEAASLLLSSRAVTYVGDLSKITSPFISQILKAIDSEVVSQVGKDDQSKSKFPLKTAVWGHWNCDKHSIHDINHLQTLINIFGIPFMGDESNENDEDLAGYILTKAVEPYAQFDYFLPSKHIRNFLEDISLQKVEMSSMASLLIRNYFVASRQERPQSLPIRSIQIMTRMAESSARINQRQVVLHEDALVAAYLYEETLAILFGPSIYSPPLDRNLNATDRLIDIVKKTDDAFMKFSLWLDQYVKTLSCSTTNNSLFDQ